MPPNQYRAVLMVDDDADVRRSLASALRKKGFIVIEATSSQAAVGMELVRFDVIVTDLFMPDVDGLEIIRVARQHQKGVPVVAMSGGASGDVPDQLNVAEILGAAATLLKPFDLDELFETIERVLFEAQ